MGSVWRRGRVGAALKGGVHKWWWHRVTEAAGVGVMEASAAAMVKEAMAAETTDVAVGDGFRQERR